MAHEDAIQKMRDALAEYFDCEPESIGNFIVGCERDTETGATFSSVFTLLPHWHLLGFIDELRHHIEQQRENGVANGEI